MVETLLVSSNLSIIMDTLVMRLKDGTRIMVIHDQHIILEVTDMDSKPITLTAKQWQQVTKRVS
jgi:hypothetical protein